MNLTIKLPFHFLTITFLIAVEVVAYAFLFVETFIADGSQLFVFLCQIACINVKIQIGMIFAHFFFKKKFNSLKNENNTKN